MRVRIEQVKRTRIAQCGTIHAMRNGDDSGKEMTPLQRNLKALMKSEGRTINGYASDHGLTQSTLQFEYHWLTRK